MTAAAHKRFREMDEEPTLVDEADTAAASPGTRSSPRWERSAKNGGSANCMAPGCAVAGGAVFSSLTCAPPCSLSCAVAQLVDGLTPGRVGAGRYHCRRCGRAVCWDCSKRTCHLSVWIEEKKPHTMHRTPSAGPLQVCDGCFEAEQHTLVDEADTARGLVLVRASEAETPGRKQALGPEPEPEPEPTTSMWRHRPRPHVEILASADRLHELIPPADGTLGVRVPRAACLACSRPAPHATPRPCARPSRRGAHSFTSRRLLRRRCAPVGWGEWDRQRWRRGWEPRRCNVYGRLLWAGGGD